MGGSAVQASWRALRSSAPLRIPQPPPTTFRFCKAFGKDKGGMVEGERGGGRQLKVSITMQLAQSSVEMGR